jgi:hypothetical protein
VDTDDAIQASLRDSPRRHLPLLPVVACGCSFLLSVSTCSFMAHAHVIMSWLPVRANACHRCCRRWRQQGSTLDAARESRIPANCLRQARQILCAGRQSALWGRRRRLALGRVPAPTHRETAVLRFSASLEQMRPIKDAAEQGRPFVRRTCVRRAGVRSRTVRLRIRGVVSNCSDH